MNIRHKSGFTMIEMLIVTVLIGLIAALAVPEFAGAIQKIRWHSISNDIVSALRLARSSAIAKQTQFGVDFNTENGTITVFKDMVNKSSFTFDWGDSVIATDSIAAEIDYLFASPSDRAICFFPNGRAADWGHIMGMHYTDEIYQTFTISVLPATGRVAIEYMEN